jgi:NAD(P)-dependent dehydrogenase (short-subunit alcohol dehydrogenase family)
MALFTLSFVIKSSVAFLFIYLLRKYLNSPRTNLNPNLKGKIAIVTGSNTGIGREAAYDLLRKGAKVIFACRDENKTREAINAIKNTDERSNAYFIKLDLSDFNSILNFANEFKLKFSTLDYLVNNAGMAADTYKTTKTGVEWTIYVNHLSVVLLTSLLIDTLKPEARIVNVSSRGHKRPTEETIRRIFADKEFKETGSFYQLFQFYGFSKLGNVYHARHLDEYFQKNKINAKAVSLHPGVVNTEIFSSHRLTGFLLKLASIVFYPLLWFITKDVVTGAATTLHCVYEDYNNINSGGYYNNCKEERLGMVPSNREKMLKFMDYTRDVIEAQFTNREVPKELKSYFK